MSDLAPAAADGLYELPPEEFVAARDALAKSLRADGDKAQAAVVAKLRRPSPSAYALNTVARSSPDLVADALEAGDALRQASEAAAGGDASGLRAATTADREATNKVVAAAAGVLGSKGDALRQELAATVRAAVLDPDVAAELQDGVLTTHHAAPGFGFGIDAGGGDPAPKRERPAAKKAAAPAKKAGKAAAATKDPAAEAQAAAERKAAQEAAAADEARRREHRKLLAEQKRIVTRLDATAARLSERADRAEDEATKARRAADAAEAELAAAQDRLAELEDGP